MPTPERPHKYRFSAPPDVPISPSERLEDYVGLQIWMDGIGSDPTIGSLLLDMEDPRFQDSTPRRIGRIIDLPATEIIDAEVTDITEEPGPEA
jgi:hypothetical protein